MTAPIVVVGGGLAAGKAVVRLRELGHDGEVVVLTEEGQVPYERPPLSKGYLQGEASAESAYVVDEDWYAAHDVQLRTRTRVDRLDLDRRTVVSHGEEIAFDKLLLATGARPRRLPLEPTEAVQVRYLRTLDDSTGLHARLGHGHHLLVVGAGWIGMEVAATARTLGTTVTVVDPAEQPLLAALGPELGARFAEVHRQHGVDLRTGTVLDRLAPDGAHLSDGSVLAPDTVLVGVGVVPNVELAEGTDIAVDNGVLVDAGLRTTHPAVFAAGDVANAEHPRLGTRIRVEHWQNAIDQGRAAAHALAGEAPPPASLPYFFTDQYDLGMEYFGHVPPGGAELRIEEGEGDAVTAWWELAGRAVAAMHVNEWDRSDELRERVEQAWPQPR